MILKSTVSPYFLVKSTYLSLLDFVQCDVIVSAVKLYPKFPQSTLRKNNVLVQCRVKISLLLDLPPPSHTHSEAPGSNLLV